MTTDRERDKLTGNGTDSASVTPKQRQLIQSLLTWGDIVRACEAAEVSRSSAYRWMRLPAFTAALRDAEREVLTATSRQLARLGARAVQTLENTLTDPEVPAAVRVRAADAVLTKLLQLHELVDQNDRLTALEAALAAQEEGNNLG